MGGVVGPPPLSSKGLPAEAGGSIPPWGVVVAPLWVRSFQFQFWFPFGVELVLLSWSGSRPFRVLAFGLTHLPEAFGPDPSGFLRVGALRELGNKNQPTGHMVHMLRQATWALGCFSGWLVRFAGRDRDWSLCGSTPLGFSEAGCLVRERGGSVHCHGGGWTHEGEDYHQPPGRSRLGQSPIPGLIEHIPCQLIGSPS